MEKTFTEDKIKAVIEQFKDSQVTDKESLFGKSIFPILLEQCEKNNLTNIEVTNIDEIPEGLLLKVDGDKDGKRQSFTLKFNLRGIQNQPLQFAHYDYRQTDLVFPGYTITQKEYKDLLRESERGSNFRL